MLQTYAYSRVSWNNDIQQGIHESVWKNQIIQRGLQDMKIAMRIVT